MAEQTIDFAKGIVHTGGSDTLRQVMEKAARGEGITLGFLGGSITQGCLSSTPQTCYAYLVYKWWQQNFPDSRVNYINAGIGGTSSQFGVARVDDDLLVYDPDFVIVEFSVNDDNTPFFEETYEGLLRHILKSKKKPAILIVNSIFWEDGHNAQEIHNALGAYYEIPCVSMQSGIYPLVADGVMKQEEVTTDGLHPNDFGHKLMAEQITYYLEQVKNATQDDGKKQTNALQDAITANGYEHSKRYQNMNCTPVCQGFVADSNPQENIRDIFKHGWVAGKLHDRIEFQIKGSGIAIQYRKTIRKPSPIAKVIVDGKEEWSKILDGNFEETWGDCLYIDTICQHIDFKEHSVVIELIETHETDQEPFYLVSVIAAQ